MADTIERRATLTKDGDYSGFSPAVRALCEDWQRAADTRGALVLNMSDAEDEASYQVQTEAGQRIASYQPQSLHDAASLLQVVYLDEDTESAWHL